MENNKKPILSEILLSRFKSLMKECLNHAEEVLDEKKYKLFKSYVMYSTYHNFREAANDLVNRSILEKGSCSCKIETKNEHQNKDCKCRGTEFTETDKFIKLYN